jgi:hypothetical protein
LFLRCCNWLAISLTFLLIALSSKHYLCTIVGWVIGDFCLPKKQRKKFKRTFFNLVDRRRNVLWKGLISSEWVAVINIHSNEDLFRNLKLFFSNDNDSSYLMETNLFCYSFINSVDTLYKVLTMRKVNVQNHFCFYKVLNIRNRKENVQNYFCLSIKHRISFL